MGVLAEVPADLDAFYGSDYYGSGADTLIGYSNYEYMAEFGVAWAAALVRLLSEPGRVLDIGSANGQFLRKLMPAYECFGIEVNASAAQESRSYGIKVIAHDIFDAKLVAQYRASFDVISALAVFEHVDNIRRAVEVAAALLKPNGLLLFELPLIDTATDDGVWFRSSLEHVWYPTERGVKSLFQAANLRLVGKEQEIFDFGSTYVGIAYAGPERPATERRFRELMSDEPPKRPEDARFRCLFDLVHAAKVAPSTIDSLTALRSDDLNPLLVARLAALWRTTEEKRQAAQAQAATLEAEVQLTENRGDSMMRAIGAARRELQLAAKVPGLVRHVTGGSLRMTIKLLARGEIAAFRDHVRWFAEAHGVSLSSRTPLAIPAETWPSDRPLVSVVVVCFNYGSFVKDAIDSVLTQTAAPLCEVIVVDGGSTDTDTVQTMREIAANPPPRTRVLLREDGAHLVGDNRNFGIQQARGRYVACLDADDLLDPRYIEVALYLLERRGYDIVSTTTQCFGESDAFFGLPTTPDLTAMSTANAVTTVAVYRRKLWEEAGGYHDSGIGANYVFEDWQLWLRIAALGARITNIQAPLFRYRVHSSASLSTQKGAIPDIAHQRAAVLAYNADVLSPAAVSESKRRASLEITVQGAFENLRPTDRCRRPTVLFAVPFLIVGGAERLISAVAAHLAQAGFRLVVVSTLYVSPEFGDSTSWFEKATAEIYHLPRLLRREYAPDFLDYLVDTKHVDILFLAGSELAYHELPGLRERHPNLRVVDLLFNTHGHVKNNREYADHIDLHFCENVGVRDWLLANGQGQESVVLVESGVEAPPEGPSARCSTRSFRVGFSGRLAEEKAPLSFVDVVRRTPGAEFEFVITGAGPLESSVRREVARLSDTRLRFLGVVDDIGAHIASLDVLVLPSILDGRPVVVLEALVRGVPVIASRVGGLPALVREGETGFLVEPGDTAAISRHLRRLSENPTELEALRKSARRFAERNLDAEAMNRTYEHALRSLLPSRHEREGDGVEVLRSTLTTRPP